MKQVYARPKCLKEAHFHYCPGCGHSIVNRLIAEVVDEMELRDRIICVAPAGCGMLLYNYFDVDTLESAHGRGAAVATGIKRVLPDNLVFSYQGGRRPGGYRHGGRLPRGEPRRTHHRDLR